MTAEEVLKAQRGFLPVVYKGMYFDQIVARIVKTFPGKSEGSWREVLCVRMINKKSNSVTEALAKDVEFLSKEDKGETENEENGSDA